MRSNITFIFFVLFSVDNMAKKIGKLSHSYLFMYYMASQLFFFLLNICFVITRNRYEWREIKMQETIAYKDCLNE